jgi:hypothetical protein
MVSGQTVFQVYNSGRRSRPDSPRGFCGGSAPKDSFARSSARRTEGHLREFLSQAKNLLFIIQRKSARA